VEYPAAFQLVAARNPCPCGFLGHPKRSCECSPAGVRRYRARVSGPLLERIDLRVEVSPLSFDQWAGPESERTAAAAARVAAARAVQAARLGASRATNARMTAAELRRHCRIGGEGGKLLEDAARARALSARSLDRLLKVARTVADLGGARTSGASTWRRRFS